jgi:outer membrane protein assembly factor BamB
VHGNGGSPVLVGDLLVFSGDGAEAPFVGAIDRANGRLRWTRPRNTPARKKFSFSTPLVIEVDGSTQIVSPGSGFVAGYDPRDGHEIWRVSYDEGYSVITRPVFAQGLLFVSSSYDAPVLYAIDPAHASGDVTETHVRWTHRRAVPNTPSPIVVREELYYVSDAGVATCADARTGEIHWQNRLGGTFSASPVFAEGRLYFQNEAGVTYVVRASSVFELLARNDLEARTLASAAVATGVIFVRTESHLWHIGKGS